MQNQPAASWQLCRSSGRSGLLQEVHTSLQLLLDLLLTLQTANVRIHNSNSGS
jgi:hypothetical protein